MTTAELKGAYLDGMALTVMAKRNDMTVEEIVETLRLLGIPVRDQEWTPGQRRRHKRRDRGVLQRLHDDGMSVNEMSEASGIPVTTVRYWYRQTKQVNEQSYAARRIDDTAALKLYRQGLTDKAIADKLGSTLHRVKYWRKQNHLPRQYEIRLEKFRKLIETGLTVTECAEKMKIPNSMADRYYEKIKGEEAHETI